MKCYLLFFIAAFVGSITTNAQKVNKNFTDLYPIHRRIMPVLNPSIDVAKLSKPERNQLIEKLYEVDQMYRAKIYKIGWTSQTAEAKRYNLLIGINDPVNQAILLKILKLDGWPCDPEKGNDALSHKAWFIVWHAQITEKSLFYPYLKVANRSNCIDEDLFKQVDDIFKAIANRAK